MTNQFNIQQATQFIKHQFTTSVVPSISDYIRIPNLSRSYDPQWQTNGFALKAAEHIKAWVEGLKIKGLKSEILFDEGFSPLIFTEVEGDLPETVFYYGHYDKQPHMAGWKEGLGPIDPVIRDGKLYGRGGADDGYSTYGTFLSILACQLQGIKIPRCVMITEGDEESGSGHMKHYLEKLKPRIGNPLICFCLDSGTLDYETFYLTNSLRGLLSFNMTVEILKQGVHSGDASGIVPESFRIFRQLLQRVENNKTGQLIEDLTVNIPPERYDEVFLIAQELKNKAIKNYPLVQGAHNVTTNPVTAMLNRGWRPTLCITGVADFPNVKQAGNVLRSKSTFKLSFRLPPTKNAQDARKKVQELLTTDVPYGAKVTIENVMEASGWSAPKYTSELQNAIAQASTTYFNRKYLAISEGVGIPLLGMFSAAFPKAQFIVTGVLGPESNAHGPNEFLHLDYCERLINSMTLILARVSQHYARQKGQK